MGSILTLLKLGMGVSYDGLKSELISESERGIWKAGKRCPDIYLSQTREDPRRLYSMLSYGKFLVLMIGGKQGCRCCFKDICAYLTLLPQKPGRENESCNSGSTVTEEHIFSSEVVTEDQKFVVVVRPDMYIGYVGDGDGWKEYLATVYVH